MLNYSSMLLHTFPETAIGAHRVMVVHREMEEKTRRNLKWQPYQ